MDSLYEAKVLRPVILVPALVESGPILGAVALAKQLSQLGCAPLLMTLDTLEHVSPRLSLELSQSNILLVSANLPGWRSLWRFRRLKRSLVGIKPDVVCSFGIRPDLVNSLTKGPWARVASIRGMFRSEYSMRYGSFVGKIATIIHLRVLRRMSATITLSRPMQNWLSNKALRITNVHHVPNFVDPGWVTGSSITGKQKGATTSQSWQLLIISSLIARKRVDWAIHAAATLRKEDPSLVFQLHIVGTGSMSQQLAKQCVSENLQGNVVFHGQVSDIRPLLNSAHIVLLTSASEGMPRSILEAMSLGKTCLASRVEGIDELIIHGKTGYLFDAQSQDDLANQLLNIISQPSLLEPRVIQEHVALNFNAKKSAQQVLQIFRSITENEKQGNGSG